MSAQTSGGPPDGPAIPASSRAGRNLPMAIGVGLALGALAITSLLTYRQSFILIIAVRRKAKDALDKLSKDGDAGEDDVSRAEKELQSLTDQYVAQVDELVKHKEAELLEV